MTRTLLALALVAASAAAAADSWTYRGTLSDAGAPANGRYDLRLTLLDEARGIPIAAPLTLPGVLVRDGQFAAEVDFGLDLRKAPALALRTEVQQGGGGFVALGAPAHFDAKAALAGVCWDTEGNAGTDPALNFIGTTDAQPLVLRTRNAQSLRLEPSSALFGGAPITANVIAGSSANGVAAGVRGATIAGGGLPTGDSDPDYSAEAPNRVTDNFGVVGGGWGNVAGDNDPALFTGLGATVAGGVVNSATSSSSTVGGGAGNLASAESATIAGGINHQASGQASSISGGSQNIAQGVQSTIGGGGFQTASGDWATIAGGLEHVASGVQATIGGGRGHVASAFASTVGGGLQNVAGGQYSSVGGGTANTASGQYSTTAGGQGNCAGGDWSWSGGRQAKSRRGTEPDDVNCAASSGDANGDEGSFAWADAQAADFQSTGPNQFLVRAAGGVYLGTTSTVSFPAGRFLNTSTGGFLTTGGTWTNASSRALKTGFEAIDVGAVLARVLELPLTRWRYIGSPAEGPHLGPVAEDFHAAFGLGADGRAISTVDASGVALAAIQGMDRKLLDARDALAAENAGLRAELGALQDRLAQIEAALDGAALSPRSRR
jgi:hypothetical protein